VKMLVASTDMVHLVVQILALILVGSAECCRLALLSRLLATSLVNVPLHVVFI